MDKRKDLGKCFDILSTEQFIKLPNDPTSYIEKNVQRNLRKIKQTLPKDIYIKLYQTGSSPVKFYRTAKIHKLSTHGTVDELPHRPIISNVNTAIHQLAHYLAKLLSALSRSEFTVESINTFANIIKQKSIPSGYKLVSFDVKSLFTNVPLDRIIEITLKRIYEKQEKTTDIGRKEMKDLLLLCKKNVPFTFENDMYQHIDGVAMGSPLGPVLAGIIMVELEKCLVPELKDHLCFWKRYVDNTSTFVKESSIEYMFQQLNSFHRNIQFTYELEKNNKIPFLDVLIIRHI